MRSNLSVDRLPAELAGALERSRERLGPVAGRVLYFPVAGSTNDIASALAAGGAVEGTVVVADAQQAGRGRRGRSWFSPAGGGLYVSVVLTPSRARADADRASLLLTLAAGVALAEAVLAVTGLRVGLKWPNDLHVERRKLAGVLAETVPADDGSPVATRAVVLGYGLNVAGTAYPPGIAGRATSLESELGRPIDRVGLLVETLVAIGRRYGDLLEARFDAILDAWRAWAPGSCGARVSWTTPAGTRSGVTAGIDGRGALLVSVGDRLERIVAGDVTWD